jgi:hypothetical protein
MTCTPRGTDESFNGRFREERLDLEWFRNREEARVVIGRGVYLTTKSALTRVWAA